MTTERSATSVEIDGQHQLPVPPPELRDHAGPIPTETRQAPAAAEWFVVGDDVGNYERLGRRILDRMIGGLPPDWSFEGKRVLDFGCGAGRLLRHLVPEAGRAEIWGCDIHRPSIEWLEQNLAPPINVYVSGELPPLPHDEGAFDLILATSVFTHLDETWSAWLAELHRVLAEGGLLVATFKNRGSFGGPDRMAWHDDWDEDQIGMHVFGAGRSWERRGPAVYHSEWWLRAHWGRAFDFLEVQRGDFGQGLAVMRRRPGAITGEELEALEPDEPREVQALQYSLRNTRREVAHRLEEANRLSGQFARTREQLARARAKLRDGRRTEQSAPASRTDHRSDTPRPRRAREIVRRVARRVRRPPARR